MSGDSAASVVDLSEYRRRREARAEWSAPRPVVVAPQLVWVPTAWGWVLCWGYALFRAG